MQNIGQRGIVSAHIRLIVHNHVGVLVRQEVLLQIHIPIVRRGLPGGCTGSCAGSGGSARGSRRSLLATGRPATLAGGSLRGSLLGP